MSILLFDDFIDITPASSSAGWQGIDFSGEAQLAGAYGLIIKYMQGSANGPFSFWNSTSDFSVDDNVNAIRSNSGYITIILKNDESDKVWINLYGSTAQPNERVLVTGIIESSNDAKIFDDPYFWAPFILIGNGL